MGINFEKFIWNYLAMNLKKMNLRMRNYEEKVRPCKLHYAPGLYESREKLMINKCYHMDFNNFLKL